MDNLQPDVACAVDIRDEISSHKQALAQDIKLDGFIDGFISFVSVSYCPFDSIRMHIRRAVIVAESRLRVDSQG